QPHRALRRTRFLRTRLHHRRMARDGHPRGHAPFHHSSSSILPHGAGGAQMSVRTENSILIKAPLEKIFETTSDLLRWPTVLPHYRWIRILKKDDDGMIVKM